MFFALAIVDILLYWWYDHRVRVVMVLREIIKSEFNDLSIFVYKGAYSGVVTEVLHTTNCRLTRKYYVIFIIYLKHSIDRNYLGMNTGFHFCFWPVASGKRTAVSSPTQHKPLVLNTVDSHVISFKSRVRSWFILSSFMVTFSSRWTL